MYQIMRLATRICLSENYRKERCFKLYPKLPEEGGGVWAVSAHLQIGVQVVKSIRSCSIGPQYTLRRSISFVLSRISL